MTNSNAAIVLFLEWLVVLKYLNDINCCFRVFPPLIYQVVISYKVILSLLQPMFFNHLTRQLILNYLFGVCLGNRLPLMAVIEFWDCFCLISHIINVILAIIKQCWFLIMKNAHKITKKQPFDEWKALIVTIKNDLQTNYSRKRIRSIRLINKFLIFFN